MDELTTVKTEVKTLGKRMAEYDRRLTDIEKGKSDGKKVKFSMKCQSCETAKIYCNYRASCCSSDNNKKDCLFTSGRNPIKYCVGIFGGERDRQGSSGY